MQKNLPVSIERLSAALAHGCSRVVEAKLQDASRTGVGLLSAETFEEGEAVRITIRFERETEAGRAFSVEGAIRSCLPDADGRFKVGVLLKEMSRHDIRLWHDMIQRWRAFIW